jgi:hypothetical protein
MSAKKPAPRDHPPLSQRHAVMSQQTVEVTCARCQSTRWIPDPLIPTDARGRVTASPIPLAHPYTCVRCRAVLAGRNALDPVSTQTALSPARLAALQKARKSLRTGRFRQPETIRPASDISGPTPTAPDGLRA